MKVLLGLCLVALVVSVNGFRCGSLECNDDQCCLRSMLNSYRCRDMAKEGEECGNGRPFQDRCPCVEDNQGLVCLPPRRFGRPICKKPVVPPTSVPIVGISTEVPTAGISTEVPTAGISTEVPTAGISTEVPTAGISTEVPTTEIPSN